VASLKDYAILFRAQTAAVEVGLFPLAAWLGGAPWIWLPFFVLLGVLEHFGAFAENSVSDYEYDLRQAKLTGDKADHPLIAGRMTFGQAWVATALCQTASLAMFVYVVGLRHTLWTLIPFGLFIVLGFWYNHRGKEAKLAAGLSIAFSYGFLALSVMAVWNGIIVWSLFLFVTAYVLAQIWLGGEWKELAQGHERNLLRALGSKVDGGRMVTSTDVGLLVVFLVALKVWTISLFVHMFTPWWWVTIVFAVLIFGVYEAKLFRSGPFDRPRGMKILGLGEATSYLMMPIALFWSLPVWFFLYLVLAPVLWFVLFNRTLYVVKGTSKSSFAPGV
jgi:hypothetical protein